MSARPGYEQLVASRGRAVADKIVDDAEMYSDAAHKDWDVALAWAIEMYDRPEDPELTAQQHENTRLYEQMMKRRGDAGRSISYLVNELRGDAFAYPAKLATAESVYDAEGWRLPPSPSMRDRLDWAAEQATRLGRDEPAVPLDFGGGRTGHPDPADPDQPHDRPDR